MKRSEMLDLMAKTIICQDSGFSISIAEAEILLKEMEGVGMLPPVRDIMIEGHLCDDNSWEPENETK